MRDKTCKFGKKPLPAGDLAAVVDLVLAPPTGEAICRRSPATGSRPRSPRSRRVDQVPAHHRQGTVDEGSGKAINGPMTTTPTLANPLADAMQMSLLTTSVEFAQ